jgi:hypothetical protein
MVVKMSIDAVSGQKRRSLLLVHGRDFKPAEQAYVDLSMAAMRAGIERDFPDTVGAFDSVEKCSAWYGDLNADILYAAGRKYDEHLDIGDRRNVLTSLRAVTARKKFGIGQYDRVPGKSALPEAMASIIAPVFGGLGLCVPLIGCVAKDFARYFDRKSNYGMQVRQRLIDKLCALLDKDERVILVSHGTGSVVAYDVLWQLSHDPDFKERYGSKKVDLWLTLGSPLGDSNIRKRLMGAKHDSDARFPINVISWHNVAAEDDYTCHDNTLADDFKMMMRQRVVSEVHDHKIYNLAVRYGKSNPHSSIGYFIHPRISKIFADWLQVRDATSTPIYTL